MRYFFFFLGFLLLGACTETTTTAPPQQQPNTEIPATPKSRKLPTNANHITPVSYTHLTLPTTPYV